MEDVLDLYAEEPDERWPVVCFDETPRQLIGEARVPVAPKPGRPARFDYEYVRNGTANVFMHVDAHRPWRHAKVTDRRTRLDFAECMRDLVDVHYPDAERIRVVLDNLSTQAGRALRELRACRGTPHSAPARVSLHAQARELAEHGRDRDRRDGLAVPGPPHPDEGAPRQRGERLAAPSEPREGAHPLAIHGRQSAKEARAGVSRPGRGEWKSGRCLVTVTFTVSQY